MKDDTTPPLAAAKPKRKLPKRNVLAVLLLLIAAAAGGYAYYKQTATKTATNQPQTTETKTEDAETAATRKKYDEAVATINGAEGKANYDVNVAYISAVANGAKLNEPKTQDYAKYLLSQAPADLKKQSYYPQFKSLYDALEAAAKGDYSLAKQLKEPYIPTTQVDPPR
jgi:uncharacterized protein HemX